MNGRFTSGSQIASGSGVTIDRSIEMPVTPPSMKWLVRRKPFNPIPAENTPAVMRKMLSASRLIEAIGGPIVSDANAGVRRYRAPPPGVVAVRAGAAGVPARSFQLSMALKTMLNSAWFCQR